MNSDIIAALVALVGVTILTTLVIHKDGYNTGRESATLTKSIQLICGEEK